MTSMKNSEGVFAEKKFGKKSFPDFITLIWTYMMGRAYTKALCLRCRQGISGGNSNGDIYPCHQFVGFDEFIMGNVFEKRLDERIVERFKNTHVFVKPECSGCWARFFCSGGCNANNFLINGDMNVPYEMTCKLQKRE